MAENPIDETAAATDEGREAEPAAGADAAGEEADATASGEPSTTEPAPEDSRIWDPITRRWMAPEEIEHGRAHRAAPARLPPAPGVRPGPPAPSVPATGTPAAAPGFPGWASTLLAGVVGAVLVAVVMLFVPGFVSRQPRSQRAPATESEPSGGGSSAAELARSARPWVVNLAVSGTVESLLGTRQFQSSGSGIVMTDDGVIATSARLVATPTAKVTVTFASGATADAKIVGADPVTDVAVVKVQSSDLSAAVLGTAEPLEPGDTVVAVSAPKGIETVVQPGAVSGTGRVVDPGDGEPMLDLIQINAPLSAGGPGGVVVGTGNSAVGMTAAVGDTGIGYATPIDIVRAVTEQLVAGKKVSHPWLGLTVEELDADTSVRLDATGVVVASVFAGSPAEKAGVKPGDTITSVDGAEFHGPLSLLKDLLAHKVGDQLVLAVRRETGSSSIKLAVAERPSLK